MIDAEARLIRWRDGLAEQFVPVGFQFGRDVKALLDEVADLRRKLTAAARPDCDFCGGY